MPSSIITPEVPSRYTCLDSAAFDGDEPMDAMRLESIVLSANRLLSRRALLLGKWWSTYQSIGEGSLVDGGYGYPDWVLVDKWHFDKMPWHLACDVTLTLEVSNADTVDFQFCTKAKPFVANAITGNFYSYPGTGSFERFTVESLQLTPGSDREYLEIWARGQPTGRLMSEVTYGVPNSDTIGLMHGPYELEPAGGATWDATGDTLAWRHYVEITSGGVRLAPLLVPVGLSQIGGGSAGTMMVQPGLLGALAEIVRGADFAIYECPTFRFAHLAVHSVEALP